MPQPANKRLVTEASLVEKVQDLISTTIVGEDNVSVDYDDPSGILTVSGISTADTAENVRNTMAAALVAGSGIIITNDGLANSITIEASGGGGGGGGLTTEEVQDTVAAMLLENSNLSAVYDDSAGTYTLSVTGLALASHTHTPADIPSLTETVQDIVGSFLVSGSGVSLVYDDVGNLLTVALSGGGGLDLEGVQDAVAAMILEGNGLTATYDDTAGTYTISQVVPSWTPFTPGTFGGSWTDNGDWRYKISAGMVALHGEVLRAGTSLGPASTDGSITTSTVVSAGLPAGIIPSNNFYLASGRLPDDEAIARCEIQSSGQIKLQDVGSGLTINVGDRLIISGIYPL